MAGGWLLGLRLSMCVAIGCKLGVVPPWPAMPHAVVPASLFPTKFWHVERMCFRVTVSLYVCSGWVHMRMGAVLGVMCAAEDVFWFARAYKLVSLWFIAPSNI